MNHPLPILAAVLALGFLGADETDKAPLQKPDIVAIQGAWRTESVQRDGKAVEEGVGDYLIFAGEKLTFEPHDMTEEPEELTFALDAKASPKRLDWNFIIDGQPITVKSIFKIEGSWMTIRHGEADEPYPRDFKGNKGYLYKLKRVPRVGN